MEGCATARIIIDVRVTQGGYPGIGRATTCLVEALLRRDTGHHFLLLYQAGRPLPARVRAALVRPHRLLPTGTSLRSAADQVLTPLRLRRARADLFHSPYYAMALLPGLPYVLTVYDLIPALYPGYWPPAQRLVIRTWLHRAAAGAAHLITSSQASARDLLDAYGPAPERITVAPLAADLGWLGGDQAGEVAAAPPYLLCVCTNKPHKNLTRLVEAYALLRRASGPAPEMVIAGGWDDRYPEPLLAARRLGVSRDEGGLRFARDPSDAALRALYAGALGFVFPSLYEGFGLPVLEAMAMGLPVAASTTPAVAEVAGDACLPFDPRDSAGMARCMAGLANEPALRERLRTAGRLRAAQFSWDATALRTLEAYEGALDASRATRRQHAAASQAARDGYGGR